MLPLPERVDASRRRFKRHRRQGRLLGMARRIGATIVEIPGSHAAFITQSAAIVEVIDRAARHISQPAAQKH
jgi:hypothetical protein